MPPSEQEQNAFWAGAAPEGRARFTDVRIIGSGAYSVVARATDTKTSQPVAIKRIAEVFYDAQEAKKVLREIRLLRDFRHPNVISLVALIPPASMETFDDIFMVSEFMESDLRRIIKSRQPLDAAAVRSYMAQLLAGLHHVHCHLSIHRDLKPANILVSRSLKSPVTPYGLLRLCDFGLARVDSNSTGGNQETKREQEAATQFDGASDPEDPMEIEDGGGAGSSDAPKLPAPPSLKKQMTSYVVTRWYRAPEVILRATYTSALDLWAAGCIYKELLELTPTSRFKTGAIFPGRYCIPFSFDDDQRERQRHDQLAVITRTLGALTALEVEWLNPNAMAEVMAVQPGGGGEWSALSEAERTAQIDSKLIEACPVAEAGSAELKLLHALLEFNPSKRPDAEACLAMDYFASLPKDELPKLSTRPDARTIEAAFKFEEEALGSNELRILLANDLFQMNME